MHFGLPTYALGYVAGLLSTLSPCVLPILPILVSSATQAHPRAPLALAGGLATSYALIGTLLASSGTALGLSPSMLRVLSSLLLGAAGLLLLSQPLQQRFASATTGLGNWGGQWLARLNPQGLRGQFLIGLLMGLVWTPCAGPTLGAAIVVASRGTQLPEVALLMLLFGFGATTPLLLIAQGSRAVLSRIQGKLIKFGNGAKMFLGATLLLWSVLLLSGGDRSLETWLTQHAPLWLSDLTTRY